MSQQLVYHGVNGHVNGVDSHPGDVTLPGNIRIGLPEFSQSGRVILDFRYTDENVKAAQFYQACLCGTAMVLIAAVILAGIYLV